MTAERDMPGAGSVEAPALPDILGIDLPGVEIMDIGAMEEGDDHYAALVRQGQARVTGFEPDPEQFAKLQRRAGPYRYHAVFLGDGKPAVFNVARYPGCSSLLAPDPAVIDLFTGIGAAGPGGNFHVVRTESVQTTRLDEVSDCALPDLIKIDVQGAELAVLAHGQQKLAHAVVVECEVEFVPLYRDQPLFCDIQAFLRERGFVLHKLVDVAGRCFRPFTRENPSLPMSQLLWADAVFVRNFTALENWSAEDLLKASQVLHAIYHSYDLVALLLREHDRRHQTRLHERYFARLATLPLSIKLLNLKDRP
jgi:FkbM family methyltransferase